MPSMLMCTRRFKSSESVAMVKRKSHFIEKWFKDLNDG